LQAAFSLVCGLILYIITTFQVAGAVALSEGRSWYGVWHERFRWLGLHYVALAIVSIGLIASYRMVGMIGVGIILLPLVILRYSHKQYIDHTETLVGVLQQKNAKLYRQNQEIEILNAEMLDLIAAMLDLRDSSVQNHSSQVALYATEIAKQMGMSGAQIDQVRKAALLHDVGKLAIPESLLNKPATLNEAEYELVKRHPDIGAALLNDFHSFRSIVEFVRHHHERYDGSGYPAGQVGAEIPLEARILGLADAVEAMASARPYHQAMPVAGIRAELSRCSGTQFDPVVVEAFLRVLEQRGDQIIIDSSPQRLVTGFRTSSVHSNSH